MSKPSPPPVLPEDPNWEPTGMEKAAWAVILAGRAILVRARTALTRTERRRRAAAARLTLLAVFVLAWTAAGAITLAAGQGLFMAVVWAATAGLCACGVWMGLLWSAYFAALDHDDQRN